MISQAATTADRGGRIPQRALGRGGPMVGVLGFGAAPIGFLETDRAVVDRLVGSLVDRGANLLDTAAMYRGSEEAIGRAIRGRRGEVVVVSKCGSPPGREGLDPWCAESIRLSIERSLARLGIDELDAILLHSCSREVLEKGEAIGAVADARRRGLVRMVGYSGDNEAALLAAGHPEVSLLEVSLNLVDHANLAEVLPAAARRGLGVLVKRPLANAAWRAPEEQQGIYRQYAQPYHERLARLAIDPARLGLPGDPATTWPSLALRFVLSFPEVASALVGSTRPEHLAANLRAAQEGPLPAATTAAIREAYERARNGEVWPGLT